MLGWGSNEQISQHTFAVILVPDHTGCMKPCTQESDINFWFLRLLLLLLKYIIFLYVDNGHTILLGTYAGIVP